jgi:hypothetical protein
VIYVTGACRDKHHGRCRSGKTAAGVRGCECACHDGPPINSNLYARAQALKDAHEAKQIKTGKPQRTRDRCSHGHDLSPASNNRGPNGACRACKREASDRCRSRVATK